MLAERLRLARKAKGYTQEELAKLVNTKKTTISNYETKYSTPSNEMLVDLANALNTTTDYLLGRTDSPFSNTGYKLSVSNKDIEVSPTEMKILEKMKEESQFADVFYTLTSATKGELKTLIKIWKAIKENSIE